LTVPHPAAIVLPAVSNLLVAGRVAFLHLDGLDKVGFLELSIIFYSQVAGLVPDLLDVHSGILLEFFGSGFIQIKC
jgi:hypothetical protein